MTDYPELPLDQLGRQALGHVKAGDRSFERAEQQYKAAGLNLAAPKMCARGIDFHNHVEWD